MLFATLQNASRPDIGDVNIYFPIDEEIMMTALNKIGITGSLVADCFLKEINGVPALKVLEGSQINVDEMNYLAKRLDSFDSNELRQFQGAVVRDDLHTLKDLINLTFSVSDYAVVSNFSDLDRVGVSIYFAEYGGVGNKDVMANTNFSALATEALSSGNGVVTPFGVMFKYGDGITEVYDGRFFPEYDYTSDYILKIGMTSKNEPPTSQHTVWLYMPTSKICIEKAMLRAEADTFTDVELREMASPNLSDGLLNRIDAENESLGTLNDMCIAVSNLDDKEILKLEAIADYAQATTATQIRNLAENLDSFEFVPDIANEEQYGRYMIQKSGHFEFDENLDKYYDYKKYGEQRIAYNRGDFTPYGYICYQNDGVGLDELMSDNAPRPDMTSGTPPQMNM